MTTRAMVTTVNSVSAIIAITVAMTTPAIKDVTGGLVIDGGVVVATEGGGVVVAIEGSGEQGTVGISNIILVLIRFFMMYMYLLL